MEDPREVLAQRIRQKRDWHRAQAQKMDNALEVIEDLDLSLDLEGMDPSILSADPNGADPLDRDDLSIREAARIVIKQAERPLSIPEMAERLLDSSFPYEKDEETLRRSLSGVLGRWVRKEEKFFRPETGKYAPIEWRGEGEQLSMED